MPSGQPPQQCWLSWQRSTASQVSLLLHPEPPPLPPLAPPVHTHVCKHTCKHTYDMHAADPNTCSWQHAMQGADIAWMIVWLCPPGTATLAGLRRGYGECHELQSQYGQCHLVSISSSRLTCGQLLLRLCWQQRCHCYRACCAQEHACLEQHTERFANQSAKYFSLSHVSADAVSHLWQ